MRISRGFSLIETMVGAAILMTVGLTVAYLAKSSSSGAARLSNTQDACRSIAAEVINRVREHGSQAALVRWAPSADNTYALVASSSQFEQIKGGGGLSSRGGNAANPIVGEYQPGNPGVLNSHLLYLDSMNVITAILDQFPGTCSMAPGAEGIPVTSLAAPSSFGGLLTGTNFLQDYEWLQLRPGYPAILIRPRNLSRPGQPGNCSARSRPKSTVIPYREAIPALANQFSLTRFGTPAMENPEWGYEVQVTVKYQSKGGSEQEMSCQLNQMFTHKRVAPPTSQLTVTTTNSTLIPTQPIPEGQVNLALRSTGTPVGSPANFDLDRTRSKEMVRGRVQACNANPQTTTIQARVTPRAGSILYCRDRSRMRHVPPINTALATPPAPAPHFSYFANIVNTQVSTSTPGWDRLTYIRHNWAFETGTISCSTANGCRGFPPVPLRSGALAPGTPSASGLTTVPGGPVSEIPGYLRYLYTPTLSFSGNGNPPHRRVSSQHQTVSNPLNYNNVIISLFGTGSTRPQADNTNKGWFPCHQLASAIGGRRVQTTLSIASAEGCSAPGSEIRLNFQATTGQYTFHFNNLKRGCEIVMDVVEVDPTRSLSTVFNDQAALSGEYTARRGRTVTTISEYVAEQSPGSNICYNPALPTAYFFRCGACAAGQTPLPDYLDPAAP